MSSSIVMPSVAPTVDTNAYADGDLISDSFKLSDSGMTGGIIRSVVLADKAGQNAAIDLVLFNGNPSNTTFTDNAALDVDDADLLEIVGVISIAAADYDIFANNSVAVVSDINHAFRLGMGNTGFRSDLFACLVSRGTPTYASSSDLQLQVAIEAF